MNLTTRLSRLGHAAPRRTAEQTGAAGVTQAGSVTQAAGATLPGTAVVAELAIGPPGAQVVVRRSFVPPGFSRDGRTLDEALAGAHRAALLAACGSEGWAPRPGATPTACGVDPTRGLASKPLSPVSPGPTIFLDTETTSLGSGAGSRVFLVGLAWPQRGGLLVEQLLLRDPPGEPMLLEALSRRLQQAGALCTFAGRGFDLPRLRDRYAFQRRAWPAAALPHADLLPISRVLWSQSLGSCALQRLERWRLGYRRADDLPGALCPEAYFRWVAGGGRRLAPIEPVLRHNLDDVVTLAFLGARVVRTQRTPWGAGEALGLARRHRRRRRFRAARGLLRRALARPEAGLARDATGLFAELGFLERRRGDLQAALSAWRPLLWAARAPLTALIALASLAEHRLKDLELAEQAACAARAALRGATVVVSSSDLGRGRRRGALTEGRRARLEQALRHRLARLARRRDRGDR